MKLIIAGSRTLNPSYQLIASLIQEFKIFVDEVVSGEARGVDSCGAKYGYESGKKVSGFPADWDTYGKAAGYRRNKEMAQYADALLLIWDGESKGSGHMKDIMKKLDKPIFEVILKDREKR